MSAPGQEPSKLWYVAFVVFGTLAGAVCMLLWRKRNRAVALEFFWVSFWLNLLVMVVIWAIMIATGAGVALIDSLTDPF